MHPTITDKLRYVFVYGTLRQGEQRDINRLQPAPVFIGNSQVKGTLYNLGSYPGLRLDGDRWVQGEVYQITPELERQLDEIEEVWPQQTGEYVKREVVLQCAGLDLRCLVYEASERHAQGRAVIESGDWLRRYGEKNEEKQLKISHNNPCQLSFAIKAIGFSFTLMRESLVSHCMCMFAVVKVMRNFGSSRVCNWQIAMATTLEPCAN